MWRGAKHGGGNAGNLEQVDQLIGSPKEHLVHRCITRAILCVCEQVSEWVGRWVE